MAAQAVVDLPGDELGVSAYWAGDFAVSAQACRDIFSRVVVATRLDLFIAVTSVALVFAMGGLAGIAAGYFGGPIDALIRLGYATGEDVMGSHEGPQYAVVLVDDDQVTVHLHDFMQAGEPFVL
mgnify:CR=1 FL=1